jgi:hypothetical protein
LSLLEVAKKRVEDAGTHLHSYTEFARTIYIVNLLGY